MTTVLVLEDDPDMRALLCELLLMGGAQRCLEAGSVMELRNFGERVHEARLALLDISLGATQESGLDAYRWLCAQHFAGQVAFVTGHAHSHPLVREAQLLRRVQVLRKPVEPSALLALLPTDAGASSRP